MSSIPITCPNCGFSREIPSERAPNRPVQVTCPRCKTTFPFSREPGAAPAPPETASQPAPQSVRPAMQTKPATPRPAAKTAPKPPGEGQPKAADPQYRAPAGRAPLQTARVVILLAILLGTIGYALREKIPLQKIRAVAAPSRQVITIPPPTGAPPELTAGNMSIKVTAGASTSTSPSAARLDPYEFPVFIYAVNLVGKIRVNGQEYREIKGEPDMQYSINTYGDQFHFGANSIELALEPAVGGNRSMNPELIMKVSRLVASMEGGRQVISEWKFSGPNGWPRTVNLDITEVRQ